MAIKLTNSKEGTRRMLQELKATPEGVAKKIAKATKGDSKKAIKVWNSLKTSMRRIDKNKGIILNNPEPLNQLDEQFQKYQNVLSRQRTRDKIELDIGDTNWRKEEFYMFYIIGDILKYDPWDTKGAYFGGDIDITKGEYELSIQIKSPADKFRIYYSAKYARDHLIKQGFSEHFADQAAANITAAFSSKFTTADLANSSNKKAFMEYYRNISKANWYVLFYNNGNQISAVSIPKDELINFVMTFEEYFVPKPEQSDTAKGLAFLSFRLDNTSFQLDLWENVLSVQSAIHYANADEFYKDRRFYFNDDAFKISSYNKQFWNDRGHSVLQNKFFAPIKYK